MTETRELRVADAVTVGTRGRNEDRVGHLRFAAWVLDGASGLAANEAGDARELQDFLGFVEGALERNLEARGGDGLRTLVRRVIREATERFESRYDLSGRARYELPSAGMALVRQADGALEYCLLGDCRLLVSTSEGEVRNLVGSDRLEELDRRALREMRRIRDEGSTDFADLRRAVTPRLREHRSLMNTEQGYWVLGLQEEAADRADCGTLDLAETEAVLLVSDGFYRLVDVFGAYSDHELLRAARSSKLADLVEEVRSLESRDPDCSRFPRLKPEDDASALLLTRADV